MDHIFDLIRLFFIGCYFISKLLKKIFDIWTFWAFNCL